MAEAEARVRQVVSEIGKPLKCMRHSADAATSLRPRGSEGRVVEGLALRR